MVDRQYQAFHPLGAQKFIKVIPIPDHPRCVRRCPLDGRIRGSCPASHDSHFCFYGIVIDETNDVIGIIPMLAKRLQNSASSPTRTNDKCAATKK